jgi:hypothetical protein
MEDESGGLFAPDGNYSVRIETERYSTGAGFMCRAESGYPGVEVGSKTYIQIAQDRDAAYGASPFSVVLTPSAAPGTPPVLYDLETNSGQGLQIAVTLACPAQVVIPITVNYSVRASVPAADPAGDFMVEKWTILLRGDDTPILEPGTYTFYFNPVTDVTKDTRNPLLFGGQRIAQARVSSLVKTGDNTTVAQQTAQWHVAWHFHLHAGVLCYDKAGEENVVLPSNPTWIHYNWGGPRSTSYTEVERADANVTWNYLDVKSAV